MLLKGALVQCLSFSLAGTLHQGSLTCDPRAASLINATRCLINTFTAMSAELRYSEAREKKLRGVA